MLQAKYHHRLKQRELLIFWQQLTHLINSGISLPQSLRFLLTKNSKPAYRYLIHHLYSDLHNGREFHQALARFPAYFEALICQLINVGEQTGKLPIMLASICSYLQHKQELTQKIQQALSYPLLLLLAASLLSLAMLYWLVPQFAPMFSGITQPLPLLTRVVISLSQLIHSSHPLATILIIAGIYGAGRRKINQLALWQHLLATCPGSRNIIAKRNLIYFSNNLALILQAAVPLTTALLLVAALFKNTRFCKAIYGIYTELNTGKSFHESLSNFAAYPELLIQMVRLGEESGNLAAMLHKVAAIYTAELELLLHNGSKLLEPLLIIIVGVLIGAIVIAMYLPLLQLGNSI